MYQVWYRLLCVWEICFVLFLYFYERVIEQIWKTWKNLKTKYKSNIERRPSRWEIRLRDQAGQMVKQGFWRPLPIAASDSFFQRYWEYLLLLPSPSLESSCAGFGSGTVKDTEDTYQSPQQPMHSQEVFFPRTHHHCTSQNWVLGSKFCSP